MSVVEHDDERRVAASLAKSLRTAQKPSSTTPLRLHEPGEVARSPRRQLRASSAGASSASSLATTSSVRRSRRMPAACLTISASGQNVMPSPYGRQRPWSTVARSPSGRRTRERAATCRSPAAPTMVTRRQPFSATGPLERPLELGERVAGGRRGEPPAEAQAPIARAARPAGTRRPALLALELERTAGARPRPSRGRA